MALLQQHRNYGRPYVPFITSYQNPHFLFAPIHKDTAIHGNVECISEPLTTNRHVRHHAYTREPCSSFYSVPIGPWRIGPQQLLRHRWFAASTTAKERLP